MLLKKDHSRASYLTKITLPSLRLALTSLRFQTISSAILDGHYMEIPHYILFNPLYTEPRNKFIGEILTGLVFSPMVEKLLIILSNVDLDVSYEVAQFTLAAKKIQAPVVLNG